MTVHPDSLTDNEVLHYADMSDDPWVKRLISIVNHLETELAYVSEELELLRVREIHGDS